MKIEIYSDVVCPWCYIGARRFQRAVRSFSGSGEVRAIYRPFQLDPDATSEPEPLLRALRRKYGRSASQMMQQATEAAHEEGLVFRLDQALSVSTLDAHRLSEFALETEGPESQNDVVDRLFKAYFTDGLNVAEHDVLISIATSVGLDADSVAEMLASSEGLEQISTKIAEARKRGIAAVPSYVFDGKYVLQGALPPASFVQVLTQVAQGIKA